MMRDPGEISSSMKELVCLEKSVWELNQGSGRLWLELKKETA